MSRLAFLAALLLCSGSPGALLRATDYFVSGGGNDANGGLTPATPFRTLTRALAAAGAGDRVLVGPGAYDLAAGETFPLALPSGVQVLGPGNGTAVVDSTAINGATFQTGALANPTVLAGLTIAANVGGGTAVRCTDQPANFAVVGNHISGQRGIVNFGPGVVPAGGASTITVDGNVVSCAATGIGWAFSDVAAPHTLSVTNNTVLSGIAPIAVYGLQTGAVSGILAANVTITGNNVAPTSAADTGIQVLLAGFTGTAAGLSTMLRANTVSNAGTGIRVGVYGLSGVSQVAAIGAVESNVLSGCTTGIAVDVFGAGTGVVAAAEVDIRSNAVGLGGVGIAFGGAATGQNGTVTSHCTIECNRVSANSATGMIARFGVDGAAQAAVGPLVQYNTLSNNGGGVQLLASAGAGVVNAAIAPAMIGNTIVGNDQFGVRMGTTTSGGPNWSFAPSLGGPAPGAAGRNTLAANGTFDVSVSGVSGPGSTILAENNWWSASSTAGIEPGVRHGADHGTLPQVDFVPFLSDPLGFTAGALVAGETATVTADAGCAFVAKAGVGALQVALDGVPAAAPTVAAGGASLSFLVPALAAGDYVLTVTNPGGQSGGLQVAVGGGSGGGGGGGGAAAGGGGGCFLATAAYGDEDRPEVRLLRRWRDESLAPSAPGRCLVRTYYRLSPALARILADNEGARSTTRMALAPMLGAVKLWIELPWMYGLWGAVLIWRLLRRRPCA